MVSYSSFFLSLLAATTLAHPDKCLSDKEANSIANKWQAIWGTGYLKSVSQLAKIATKDVSSFDGTYGPANIGLDALYASATYVDPLVDNVLQYPEWVFHSCDQIAIRWGYSATATGVNSTVAAGKPIYFEGIELLLIDLKSRLVKNATSSADWSLLATQVGQTVII